LPNETTSTSTQTPTQTTDNVITKSDIRRAMWRHNITLQWSWNYERMQALGFLWAMLPILKKKYPEKDELRTAMERHIAFYNTNPQVGSPSIFGAAVALEAGGAGEAADSIKVGLMGPFAGIGDTIQAVLYRPIIAVFAASLALGGSVGGPLLMLLSGILFVLLMIPLFHLGYKRGVGLVEDVSGGVLDRVTNMATALGMIVIGGFVPSIMSALTTPLQFHKSVTVSGKSVDQVVKLQDVLDKILPSLLPVLVVLLAYWMIKKLKWSPIWVLISLIVIAFVLSAIGIL
jgi:mannose/fructose/N-acetylgalactosamine-specific phosphotransferase system component IID